MFEMWEIDDGPVGDVILRAKPEGSFDLAGNPSDFVIRMTGKGALQYDKI